MCHNRQRTCTFRGTRPFVHLYCFALPHASSPSPAALRNQWQPTKVRRAFPLRPLRKARTRLSNLPPPPSSASTFAANLPDADAADAASAQPLIIEETGWWAKDGYVHYGITVRNPNSVAAANAVVQVTLFDEQGTVQGTWESAIGLVKAEQTVGFAGEAGDGLVPDRVEFAMDDNSVT